MNVKELLKEANLTFEGTTGKELEKFLKDNAKYLLEKESSLSSFEEEPYMNPIRFQISMDKENAHLLKCFNAESYILEDGDLSYDLDDAIEIVDDELMLDGYLNDQDDDLNNIVKIIKKLEMICRENNTYARLEIADLYDYSSKSINITSSSTIFEYKQYIINDSKDLLIASLYAIAKRSGENNIDEYLDLVGYDYKEELSIRNDKNIRYDDVEDIIKQVDLYPISIDLYDDKIKYNKDVFKTFINSNSKMVDKVLNDDDIKRGYLFSTRFKKYANEYNNGYIRFSDYKNPLTNPNMIINDNSLLEIIMASSSYFLLEINDDTIQNAIEKLKDYPRLSVLIQLYYEKKFYNEPKFFTKIKTKYELNDSVDEEIGSIYYVMNTLMDKSDINGIKELFRYVNTSNFKYVVNKLTIDELRNIIEGNNYLLKYAKDKFEWDDPLVEKISKNNKYAKYLVCDEAIIRYELK